MVTRTEKPEAYINFIPKGATIFYMGDNFTLPVVPDICQLRDRNKEDETVVKYFGTEAVTIYDTGATNHVTPNKSSITDLRLVVDGFMVKTLVVGAAP